MDRREQGGEDVCLVPRSESGGAGVATLETLARISLNLSSPTVIGTSLRLVKGGKRGVRRMALGALLTLAGALDTASAQVTGSAELSSGDSVEIYTEVVRAILREIEIESKEDAVRIVIPAAFRAAPGAGPDTSSIPEPGRRGLTTAFRGVRFVEDHRNIFRIVFNCPERVELQMPGSGCPIQDEGVVISLGPLAGGDSGDVSVHVWVARSVPSSRSAETLSWMTGPRLRLSRSAEGGWRVAEVSKTWIT